MTLAIFDLDNTLLAGDSDHRWGEFLCDIGMVDRATFGERNDAFYADYQRGQLDIAAYLSFVLGPIAGMSVAEVAALQDRFVREYVEPMRLPAAQDLIESHRAQGHELLIITATNTVVTEPIAARLGIPHLIGSDVELIEGAYTGRPLGIPSYREGKVTRLDTWLEDSVHDKGQAWFYSDSHNDIPLLSEVGHPVAVDPDEALRAHAESEGWPVISLR